MKILDLYYMEYSLMMKVYLFYKKIYDEFMLGSEKNSSP